VLVELDYSEVVSFETVAGAQPPVSGEEHARANAAVRSHPDWRAAVARRGVDDLENVLIQAWPPGYPHTAPALAGRRIANAIAWVGSGGEDNAFGCAVRSA
jgi:primary-amine oxidase